MGHTVEAKCLDCGTTRMIEHGGGFMFHLLRCDTCGETKAFTFEDLGELHLRYLKGLPGSYCISTSEHDRHVREHAHVEAISEDEYHKRVEDIAGSCHCGGKYTFNAPPRCEKCHSVRLEEGEPEVFYD